MSASFIHGGTGLHSGGPQSYHCPADKMIIKILTEKKEVNEIVNNNK
jgi:hypothetical protein